MTPTRRNFLWKLTGALLGGGAYFAYSVALIRYLGPEIYGRYAFALGWSGLFAILVDYGLNPVVTRDLARRPDHGLHYARRVVAIKSWIFFAAAAALLGASRLHPKAWAVLGLVLPAFLLSASMSFAEAAQAFSYAFERFRAGACLLLAHKWLMAGAGLGGILLGAGVVPIAWAAALAGAAGLVPAWLYFRRLFRTTAQAPAEVGTAGLMREAWPLFLQNVLVAVWGRLDTILLSAMRGDAETGIYGAAYRFFEVSHIAVAAFIAVVSAGLARSVLEGLWKERLLRYARPVLAMGLAGLALLHGLSYALPKFILSQDFASSAPVLRTLSLSLPLIYMNYLLMAALTMLHRQAANAWISAGAVAVNVAANLCLIPRWGAQGAAAALLLTQAAVFAAALLSLRRPGAPTSAAKNY